MDLKMLKQLQEIISSLPLEKQVEEYEKLFMNLIEDLEQKKSNWSKGWRPKKETKNKKETLVEVSETKTYWDNEINECLDMIKSQNWWNIDGTQKENRIRGKHLINKISQMDSVKAWKFTRQSVLQVVLEKIGADKYYCWKITSPKRIYYDWTTLTSRCKQQIEGSNKPFDLNDYSLPGVNT